MSLHHFCYAIQNGMWSILSGTYSQILFVIVTKILKNLCVLQSEIKINRPKNIFYQTLFFQILTTTEVWLCCHTWVSLLEAKVHFLTRYYSNLLFLYFKKALEYVKIITASGFVQIGVQQHFFFYSVIVKWLLEKNMIQSKTITFFMLVFFLMKLEFSIFWIEMSKSTLMVLG